MGQHPDIVNIDALRTGEGRPEDGQHVSNCTECRRVLEDLTALGASMKDLAEPIPVPTELEQRILWQARKQALAVRRSPYEIWRRNRWIAAAAVVVVTGVSIVGLELGGPRLQVARRTAPERQEVAANARRERLPDAVRTASADLDRDGHVDILDAFVLARAVQGDARDARAGGDVNLRAGADVNGDGSVDQRDVDAIALRAVALGDA